MADQNDAIISAPNTKRRLFNLTGSPFVDKLDPRFELFAEVREIIRGNCSVIQQREYVECEHLTFYYKPWASLLSSLYSEKNR